MKLGGLFSGIGGFELAWTRLGHEVAWMCEIDKNARKVLEERFPGVPVYEDVREIDPYEVESVDVLTGGSPCQGFSTAGRREGLLHGESQLFADYVRILDGLADRGLKYALWENVPGVLSIKNPDGERTFPHVIGALVGSDDPVRLNPKRKWNVGMATHGERAVAWRILDSRYFGVAQRRRRIFACVAIGDSSESRAGRSLLAVAEGMPRHLAEGEPAWQEPAPSVGGSVEDPRIASTVSVKWEKGTGGPSGSETGNLVADLPQAFRKSRRAQSSSDDETWVNDGGANTLNVFDAGDTRTTHAIVEPLAFDWQMGHTGNTNPSTDQTPALSATKTPAVMLEESFDEMNFTTDPDTHHVLRSGTKQSTGVLHPQYGVRRLTPMECERLQSFPDGWTEPAGSDSARYRALGNAVTVNTVQWILRRMLDAG